MRRLLISLTIIGLELIFAGQVSANAKIHESPVEYSSQGIVLKGYLAYDEHLEGKRPGILIVL